MRWPHGIAAALAVFVGMQAVLVWIAVTHQDEVVSSYRTERR